MSIWAMLCLRSIVIIVTIVCAKVSALFWCFCGVKKISSLHKFGIFRFTVEVAFRRCAPLFTRQKQLIVITILHPKNGTVWRAQLSLADRQTRQQRLIIEKWSIIAWQRPNSSASGSKIGPPISTTKTGKPKVLWFLDCSLVHFPIPCNFKHYESIKLWKIGICGIVYRDQL